MERQKNMAKVFWKGSTLLAPVPPTMVSCGTMEKPNIITVAWTGIVNSQPPMTYISVRPSRYSYELIKQSGEFVDMFLADIVGVNVGEQYLDENGKLCVDQGNLACYMHGEYFAPGKKLGTFGYSVRKKTKRRPGPREKKSQKK